jgi:hypothetical protein
MAASTPVSQEDIVRAHQALAVWHTQILAAEERLDVHEIKRQKNYKAYTCGHATWLKFQRTRIEQEKMRHSRRVRDLEKGEKKETVEDAKNSKAIALSSEEAEEGFKWLEELIFRLDEVEKRVDDDLKKHLAMKEQN